MVQTVAEGSGRCGINGEHTKSSLIKLVAGKGKGKGSSGKERVCREFGQALEASELSVVSNGSDTDTSAAPSSKH